MSEKLDIAMKNFKDKVRKSFEAQVVELYPCPKCDGTGEVTMTVRGDPEVYRLECPYCFGRPQLSRVVPLGQTKLWQEMDERVRAIEQWIEQQGGSHDRVR